MSDTKHTPAPWKWDSGNNQIESQSNSHYRFPICDLCTETDLDLNPEKRINYEANAKLIAAAPEMLEMINKLKERLEFIYSDRDCYYSDSGEISEIEKLIKKATE